MQIKVKLPPIPSRTVYGQLLKSQNTSQQLVEHKKKKYDNRAKYLLFLKIVNLSNNLRLAQNCGWSFNAFVGPGNNNFVIKSTIRRRNWWKIQQQSNTKSNLIWTQKIDSLHQNMKSARSDYSVSYSPIIIQQINQKQQNTFIQCKKRSVPTRDLLNQPRQNNKLLLSKIFGQYDINTLQEKYFSYQLLDKINKKDICRSASYPSAVSHNHLQEICQLSFKKNLFKNLKNYLQINSINPYSFIPYSYHIVGRILPTQIAKFKEQSKKLTRKQVVWFIKPGEDTNRGIDQIQENIKKLVHQQKRHTFLIQQYIIPLTYCRRKFDIRAFMLITSSNGIIKGYWYKQGYIRTSSKQFNMRNFSNRGIHLTNDSIQKKIEGYGKHQASNKISWAQFEKYIQHSHKQKSFYKQIYPAMKQIAKICLQATYKKLDPIRRDFGFQLLGLDFLIDDNFKVWLIEINNNPCLQTPCVLLNRIISQLIQNTFRIAIDPHFPPPNPHYRILQYPQNLFEKNRFELIFDQICP